MSRDALDLAKAVLCTFIIRRLYIVKQLDVGPEPRDCLEQIVTGNLAGTFKQQRGVRILFGSIVCVSLEGAPVRLSWYFEGHTRSPVGQPVVTYSVNTHARWFRHK